MYIGTELSEEQQSVRRIIILKIDRNEYKLGIDQATVIFDMLRYDIARAEALDRCEEEFKENPYKKYK